MTDIAVTSKPAGTPAPTDQVVGIKGGLIQLFTISDLPASGTGGTDGGVDAAFVNAGDAATLTSANAHADSGDATQAAALTAAVTAANSRMDTGDANTLASANAHADSGDTAAVASANSYTDARIAASGAGATTSYVDTHDATTLSSANSHADSGDASTLSSAHSYADSGDASTLSSANAHADSGDTATLNSAKAYTDGVAVGGSFVPGGTGSVSRSMNTKVKEIIVSVIDYGADPTGAADSTTAFVNAMAAARRVYVPAGTYKVTNLVINRSIELFGDGGATGFTTVNITTTTTHGVKIIGESSLGLGNVIRLRGIKFTYTGTGQPALYAGMLVQRKVYADDVYVRNFTNDGIKFAPSDAAADGTGGTIGNAVFFSEFRNVWSKSNGQDGLVVRMGANANTFINCQLSSNGRYGVHHFTDGGATYGNVFISGQCSYNGQYGYYFESGTNCRAIGLYCELNWSTDGTNGGGYGVGVAPFVDVYVGDNFSRSNIEVGTVFNNDNTHVRAPTSGLNDGIGVFVGADRIFGSTSSHLPHETSTFSSLAGTATLSDVITQVNLIRTKLQTAGVVQ